MTRTIILQLTKEEKKETGFYKIPDTIIGSEGKKYEINDKIGSAKNAVVFQCTSLSLSSEYAVKFQLNLNNNRGKRFQKEIEFLKNCNHDHIVKYIDNGNVTALDDEETIIPFLIMQLANTNLKEFLKKKEEKPSYADYIGQFKGLSSALATIHEKAIHRDIKPENILIAGETWLLSDFGFCDFLDSEEDIVFDKGDLGPRNWMSPEGTNRELGNSDKIMKYSDVYQLCSVFWYVVTGRHPTGIVRKQDWTGPTNIFEVVFKSLYHESKMRPIDGSKLVELLEEATIPKQRNKLILYLRKPLEISKLLFKKYVNRHYHIFEILNNLKRIQMKNKANRP